MIRVWLLSLMLLIVLHSCTKDGKNITVLGRVYNPVTGAGIPNCEIRLLKETMGSPGTSGGYDAVASVYSDDNGYFELNHSSIFVRYVGCYVDTDKYHEIGWVKDGTQTGNVSFEKVNLGSNTYLNCEVVPYGQLSMTIQNVNCEGASDDMQFRSRAQYDSNYSYWSTIREGCYSYASTGPVPIPTGYRYYEMKVTRPSGTTYVYDTVFIPETGTAQIDLFY